MKKRLIISLITLLCMCASCFAGTLYIRTGGYYTTFKVYRNCFYTGKCQDYTFQFTFIEDGKEHKLYVNGATEWWFEED